MIPVPNTPTPAAVVPKGPEILSRAQIAQRRQASEKQPEVVPVKRKGGWPKGRKRK